MPSLRLKVQLFAAAIIVVFLAACTVKRNSGQPASTGTIGNNPSASVQSTQPGEALAISPSAPISTSASTNEPVTGQSSRASPTLTPLSGDWRDAPIMPVISSHVLQIYQEGQAQGRDPHSFSVIGDCQAVPVVFMGPYELGQLAPASNENYLWDVIHYFKGSFARWGMAVRGGFTAASILTPMQADPTYCKAGETPLTCEYRIHNPAFVFITLETWLDPKTVDRYDGYLRKIMDYVISHGSVPILLTKADSSEMRNGTHVFNPVIIQVAHDYDVPVINFWRAAQYLPNSGIDPNREGFHLSQAGYDLKNTLALRVLYNVWTTVTGGSVAGGTGNGTAGSATATPTPSSTPVVQAGPVITTPDCGGGGCVYYATAGSQDGVIKFQGVFAYNYQSKKQIQVLGEGFDLQDVSQDGLRLLVNDSNDLYEVNLADASSKLVSDSFYFLGKQDAYWNKGETSVVFVDKNHPIQAGTGSAFNLFPSPVDGQTYFESGSCSSQDFCQSGGVYRLNADQSITPLKDYSKPVFSPAGNWMAYLNPAAATSLNYYHINYLLVEDPQKGIGSRRVFYLPDDHIWMRYPDVRDMAFSPDGKKLFVLDDIYSEYFENSLRLESYMVDLSTGILYNYGKLTGQSGSFKPRLVWSPQGDKVLFFLTTTSADNQYSLGIYQTTLNTADRFVKYDPQIKQSSEYFYITNIYWR